MSRQDNKSKPIRVNPITSKHDQKQIAKNLDEMFEIALPEPDSSSTWEICKALQGVQVLGEQVTNIVHTFRFKAIARGVYPISLDLKANNNSLKSFEVHIYVD